MEVIDAILARHSVRAFLSQPIDSKLVQQLLEVARFSPSGTNTQPWQVAVVSGETKKNLDQKLIHAFENNCEKVLDYNYYPSKVPREMQLRRVDCGMRLYGSLNIARDDKDARLRQWKLNYSAFNAPVALYFFMNKDLEKGSFMDFGMFLQSIMMLAVDCGLASCPQAALAEYPQIVREYLNYSDDNILLCGMALGYEDKDHPVNNYKTPRMEVNQFTRFFD